MRKSSIFAIAAAVVLTASGNMPVTAYAATGTYNIPNGKMIVIGGNCGNTGDNGSADYQQVIQDILGGSFPGMIISGNGGNCNSGILGQLPGIKPGQPDSPGTVQPDSPDTVQPDNPNAVQPDNPGTGQPGADSGQDAFADQVVALVNGERAKAGLSPVTVHSGAAKAAQVRARELETRFSHTRPDGRDFSTALSQMGVSYRGSGENIAYGQNSPEQVMKTWMNSSGHRANILNPNYTSIGVGHYRNAAGVDYWEQVFVY